MKFSKVGSNLKYLEKVGSHPRYLSEVGNCARHLEEVENQPRHLKKVGSCLWYFERDEKPSKTCPEYRELSETSGWRGSNLHECSELSGAVTHIPKVIYSIKLQ